MAEGYHSSGGYLTVKNDEDSPLVCNTYILFKLSTFLISMF